MHYTASLRITEDSKSQPSKKDRDRNDKEEDYVGCAAVQVLCHRPLNTEDRVQSQASPCWICGGQSGNGAHFAPSISVFPHK
jgi:hypothetical protein